MNGFRTKFAVFLLPALLLLSVFVAGMVLAILQSVGYFAPTGEHGFTLIHYHSLFFDPELRASLLFTFLWATAASAASMVLGLAVALALREAERGSHLLTGLLQVPIAVPHLAMAILILDTLGQAA